MTSPSRQAVRRFGTPLGGRAARKVLLIEPFEAVLRPIQDIACNALWLPAGPAELETAVETVVRMFGADEALRLPCLAWVTTVEEAVAASWRAFWPWIAAHRPTHLLDMTILRDQARLPGELRGLLATLYPLGALAVTEATTAPGVQSAPA